MSADEKTIIIVDDEPDMCWALEHILETNGFSARKALSGQEALTLLTQHSPASLFLDAKLPDMEGLELARRIQKLLPGLHIVMVSGYFYRDDVEIQQALATGIISGFIAKPFRRDEILDALEKNPAPRQESVP
ncbi:MAG TPA: response regulator [Geopsychrobacteraceae bacterium]|jgi:CheY-like chemotaxis protein